MPSASTLLPSFSRNSHQPTQPTAGDVPTGHRVAGARPPGSPNDVVVFTPSRLRTDSRVLAAHAASAWLPNAVAALLILLKLTSQAGWSWWLVFLPLWIGHAVHIPLQIYVCARTDKFVARQLGPSPPMSASAATVMQYAMMLRCRRTTHFVDYFNGAVESVAMLTTKVLFCWALQNGRIASGSISLRLIALPIWIAWAVTICAGCIKDRTERTLGSTRDLLFVFLLLVALKVDGIINTSWRLVFLVPTLWFSCLLLLAAMVAFLLIWARVWMRVLELLLPLGFLALLISILPQFLSFIALARLLDGDSSVSYEDVLVPNAISWMLMWLSSFILFAALRQKEALRDMLLASGAVIAAPASTAIQRLQAQVDRAEVQRRVDALSEAEVDTLVNVLMQGKARPERLQRIGATLYKRIHNTIPFDLHLPTASPTITTAAAGAVTAAATNPAADDGITTAFVDRLSSILVSSPSPVQGNALQQQQQHHLGELGSIVQPLTDTVCTPRRSRRVQRSVSFAESVEMGEAGSFDPRDRVSLRAVAEAAAAVAVATESSAPGIAERPRPKPTCAVPLPHHAANVQQHIPPAAIPLDQSASTPSMCLRPAAAALEAELPVESVPSPPQPRFAAPVTAADLSSTPQPSPTMASSGARSVRVSKDGRASCAGDSETLVLNGRVSNSAAAVPHPPSPSLADMGSQRGQQQQQPFSLPGSMSTGSEAEAAGYATAQNRTTPGQHPPSSAVSSLAMTPTLTHPLQLTALETSGDRANNGCLIAAAASSDLHTHAHTSLHIQRHSIDDSSQPRPSSALSLQPSATTSSTTTALSSLTLGATTAAMSGAVVVQRMVPEDSGAEAGTAEELCLICYDQPAICVFMECGHSGFCRRCAYRLYVRPPNECPTCRAPIEQVLELQTSAPVGCSTLVKQ